MFHPLRLLLLVPCVAFGASAHAQLLVYNFNDARSGSAQTISTGSSHLAQIITVKNGQPAAQCWTANGAGVTGKPGDFALDFSNAPSMGDGAEGPAGFVRDADPVLSGMKSFTLCGWYKVKDQVGNKARFFDMMFEEGGFLLGFNEGRISLQVKNGDRAGAWECRQFNYSEINAWVFCAVTYDSTSTARNVVFYKGTEDGRIVSNALSGNNLEALPQFTRGLLSIGNNGGFTRTLRGLLDNMTVYGSAADGSGALTQAAVEKIFNDVIKVRREKAAK